MILFSFFKKLISAFFLLIVCACMENPVDIYDYGRTVAGENVHVFLIGIDGWGSYSLPKADMPVVKSMMENGAWTLNEKNVLPTGSNPNWVSMFSGATPAFHGFTHNTARPTFPPVLVDEYGFFPNIFALIKKRIPNCAVAAFYEYEMIGELIPSAAIDTSKYVNGLSSQEKPLRIITDYIESIDAGTSSFTFIQFDGADGAGHSAGHNSTDYYRVLNKIDGQIGALQQAIKDAGIENESVFLLTADHGGVFFVLNNDYTGIFYQHGGGTPEERQVPLIFYGKNIKENVQIQAEAHIYDIAPTIADIFNIPRPLVWIGRPIREAFRLSDCTK
jgi:predicted AlkP superfamily pyrophosphatase or phosphodiesterase